ncbi:putative membrane protein [Bacillus clarus]|uniref:Putative membrane protein n=1 Tax=Bacillus clarus TaxID=2338372 RepID=A0A090YUP9_9BACI|nr:putative membrane protein [Bacillus clarus]
MILGIVFYRYVVQGAGYEGVSDLIMLFIGGLVVINFLNLKHSVEVYEQTGGVKRSYFVKLLLIPVVFIIGILGVCIIVTPNISMKEISITGLILFVCFLLPLLFA